MCHLQIYSVHPIIFNIVLLFIITVYCICFFLDTTLEFPMTANNVYPIVSFLAVQTCNILRLSYIDYLYWYSCMCVTASMDDGLNEDCMVGIVLLSL